MSISQTVWGQCDDNPHDKEQKALDEVTAHVIVTQGLPALWNPDNCQGGTIGTVRRCGSCGKPTVKVGMSWLHHGDIRLPLLAEKLPKVAVWLLLHS